MDVWVQNSQLWLNTTYGTNPGYVAAPTDGMTGWDTMYSLTRALQIELGISSTSDTFGPTTLGELTDHGNITSSESNHNIVGILQCALWCKGYWGDTAFGTWTSSVSSSVSQVRVAMGLGSGSAVTPKMFKSLLTMDAYVLIGSGTSAVREVQQWLNGRYKGREDFYLMPCDGLFSRDVQNGLMLAIQYEMDMDDGVANGNLGPGTKQGIIDYGQVGYGSVDSSKKFVRLFQAALRFNSYTVPFDGTFGTATQTATEAFQNFVALPISSYADFPTWASLLVSTGDINRAGTACDCVTTITPARALALTTAGYQTVGRYLTNYPGPDALDKKIKVGELSTIFTGGLSVFPIFQVVGDSIDYFSEDQGYQAAKAAHAAARAYGFNAGTTIYFAVDFDALEEEVWDVVIPHFTGINNAFAEIPSDYTVGIYGARNTCSIVSNENLAVNSFVSGMSTGYSGNLGFPLPQNWAFDQILEYSVGAGSGTIAIDKDIASGRDLGQTSLRTPATLPSFSSWLRTLAAQYIAAPGWVGTETADDLVLQYLRQPRYDDFFWTSVVGPVDPEFVAHVDLQGVPRVRGLISPGSNNYVNADHLAASLQGRLASGAVPGHTTVDMGDMAGWAGDVVQIAGRLIHDRRSDPSIVTYDFARVRIARLNGDSPYNASDFDEDIDAHLLQSVLATVTTSIDDAFDAYYDPYSGWAPTRYSRFLDDRFDADTSNAYDAIIDSFASLDLGVIAMRTGIISAEVGTLTPPQPGEITSADLQDIAQAWIDTLQQKIDEE